MTQPLIENTAGRLVPVNINGQAAVPFAGVGKHRPTGRKAAPLVRTSMDYPADGNKVVADLKTALISAGLRDGMTSSFSQRQAAIVVVRAVAES